MCWSIFNHLIHVKVQTETSSSARHSHKKNECLRFPLISVSSLPSPLFQGHKSHFRLAFNISVNWRRPNKYVLGVRNLWSSWNFSTSHLSGADRKGLILGPVWVEIVCIIQWRIIFFFTFLSPSQSITPIVINFTLFRFAEAH